MPIGNWSSAAHSTYTLTKSRRPKTQRKRVHSRLKAIEQLEARHLMAGLVLGQQVHETIGTVGDHDRFEFALTQPARVVVDGLASTQPVSWSLSTVYEELVSGESLSANSRILDLNPGEYSLDFRAQADGTYGYAFQVLDITAPPQIVPGAQVDATLNPSGALNAYRLMANAGDVFTFDSLLSETANANWRLLDPLYRTIFYTGLANDPTDVELPMTGEYLLLIDGNISDTGTLDYSFRADFIGNNPPLPYSGTPINLGSTVSSAISVADEQDSYTFSLSTETSVYFDHLSADPNLKWTLVGPSGVVTDHRPLEWNYTYAGVDTLLRLLPGDYQLTITGDSGNTGNYEWRLIDATAAPVLNLDEIVNGSLNPASETDIYRFTAAAGDMYYIDSQSSNTQNARLRLVDPLGRTIGSNNAGQDLESSTFRLNGTYLLLVEDYPFDAGTIDYSFLVHKIDNSPAVPLIAGATVSSSIASLGERDRYAFTVADAGFWYFDNIATDGSIHWTLSGPDGNVVNDRPLEYDLTFFGIDPTLKLLPGDYQLTIDGVGDTLGAYAFRMLDLSSAPQVTFDSLVSGSLDPASETGVYQFSATEGQRFFIDSQSTNTSSAYWRVIDPLGRQSVGPSPLYANLEFQATLAGTYTLLLEGYINDVTPIDYSFLVHAIDSPTETPLSLTTVISSSIASLGEQDTYTFTLSSPARLYFDNLSAADGITWTLVGPTGAVVFNRPFHHDLWFNGTDPMLNLPAGSYQLIIDGSDEALGNYSFEMKDLATVTGSPFDSLIAGSLDPASKTELYRFVLPAGTKVFVDSQNITGGSTFWRVLDPLGRNVSGTASATQDLEFEAPLAGDYTLLLEGYFGDTTPVDYAFLIHPITSPSTQALVFNTPIVGSISGLGERDYFSFNLPAASLLYFDNLSAGPGITWTLQGPTGAIISNRAIDNDSEPRLGLFEGDYLLIIDGSGDSTGAYSFQMLELATAPPVTLDSLVTATLDPASQTDRYRIPAIVGQKFFIDSQTPEPANARIRLLDPLGRDVINSSANLDVEFQATLAGDYTLLLEGYIQDTVPVNYAFLVHEIVAPSSTALTFNTPFSSDIAAIGERDIYTFTLANPGRFYFDNLSTTGGINWTLVGPYGVLVNDRALESDLTNSSLETLLNLAAGDFQLVIDGVGDTLGTYSFQMLELAAAPALTSGQVVSETLSPASRTDIYALTVIAGDAFTFDSSTAAPGNAHWRLVDPQGRNLFYSGLGNDQSSVRLNVGGDYFLVIEGYFYDNEDVSYEFQLTFENNETPTPFTGTALTLGDAYSGSLPTPEDVDHYVFTLTSETQLYFDAISAPNDNFWSLEGHAGFIVQNQYFSQDSILWYTSSSQIYRLPAGEYRLSVSSVGAATSDYEFRLSDVSSAVDVTPGTLTTGVLDPGSSTQIFKFNVAAGEQFYFDSQTSNPGNAAWHLFDPSGASVGSTSLNSDMRFTFAVPGTYTLMIEGYFYSSPAVDYSFIIQPIPAHDDIPLTLGETISDSILTPGDYDRYTFTLTADSQLYFDALAADPSLQWTLTGPSGTSVDRRAISDDGIFFYTSSSQIFRLIAGQYWLTVDGNGESVGSYAFKLSDVASGTEFSPGTLQGETLDPANSTAIYRFNANSGERFYFDSQTTASQNAVWHLFDPHGNNVASTYLREDMRLALPFSGMYTLMIEGYFYDTEVYQYSFKVQPIVEGSDIPLDLGSTTTNSIDSAGDYDRYVFTLTAETQLYFDAISSAGAIGWTLLGPRGIEVPRRDFSNDGIFISSSSEILKLPTGQYTLIVDGTGEVTGDYQFKLSDVATGTALTAGNLENGTLDPGSTTKLYRFAATAGQQFYFDSQTSPDLDAWHLFAPDGSSLGSARLSDDMFFTLPLTGTYTLAVEGWYQQTNVINYSFVVQPVPNHADIPLTLGAEVSDSIATPGDYDRYTFTLPTARQLYMDTIETTGSLHWTLRGPLGIIVNTQYFNNNEGLVGANGVSELPAGQYTLEVRSYADTIGNYRFRLTDLSTITPFTLATTIGGTLDPTSEADIYRFEATAGQYFFDAQTPNPRGAAWLLYNPIGQSMSSAGLGTDIGSVQLPFDGIYTLVIQGYLFDTENVDYQFRVQPINPEPADTQLSSNTIAENSSLDTLIGLLNTSDVDETSVRTYSLVSGQGDADNSSFVIVDNQLKSNAAFNFEDRSTYSVRVRTEDTLGLQFEQVFTILITDVNEAPTNIALSGNSIPENEPSGSTIGTFSTTDPDAANTFTYSLVAGTGSTDNSAFTITGNALSANFSFNFEAKNSYSIRVRTTDQGGLSFEKSFVIDVINVNETPTDIAISNASIPENFPASSIVGSLSTIDPDFANTFTYALVSGEGSTDNSSFTITSNSLLTGASFNFEAKNSYSIRVRTTDQGGLSFEKNFVIAVTDVNEAPTDLAISNASVPENSAANLSVGTFSTSDPDAANTFSYTLVAGTGSTDNAAFSISGNTLIAIASFNFEAKNSYSIRVRSVDQGGLSVEKVLLISVTDVNETPTDIAITSAAIAENLAAGSTVGDFSTTDPDAANTFSYSLVAGAGSTDNAAFTIAGTTLTTNSAFNFESQDSYSIRVRTTDQGGLSFEKVFVISVTDVNEAPTNLLISGTSLPENSGANSPIGTFSTSDPDAANSFTYELVAGEGSTDNSQFTITGDALTANASFNFEAKNSYSIRVRTTDQGGLSFEKNFVIAVTDVNEAPTDLAISNASVPENSAANLSVGTFSTSDPDAANTFSYTLVAGTGSTDNAAFSISGNTLIAIASFNFEAKNSYSIRVRSVDQGGLSVEKVLLISVTDVNETPTLTVDSSHVTGNVLTVLSNSGTWSDPELASITLSASLGTVVRNAGGTWTWSYTSGARLDNASVTITGTDGVNSTDISFTVDALVNVVQSEVYYKGSSFATGGVDAALASDKTLAKAGTTPLTLSYANLINTTRGINGLVFDIAGLASSTLAATDFVFRMSPQGLFNEAANPPSSWVSAPAPQAIVVTPRTDSTPGRVRIEWLDDAIANRWLQIQVLANSHTGLAQPETYYIGHLLGEMNGQIIAGAYFVSNADLVMVNPIGGTATITNHRDVDKNGFVQNADGVIIRSSIMASRVLRNITIPVAGSSAEGRAASSAIPTKMIFDNSASLELLAAPGIPPTLLTQPISLIGQTESAAVVSQSKATSSALAASAKPDTTANSLTTSVASTARSAAIEAVDEFFGDLESLETSTRRTVKRLLG